MSIQYEYDFLLIFNILLLHSVIFAYMREFVHKKCIKEKKKKPDRINKCIFVVDHYIKITFFNKCGKFFCSYKNSAHISFKVICYV